MRALLAALALLLGACSFAHVNDDVESRPDTVVGMGAKVIYPGQPGPAIGPAPPPRATGASGSASPQAPAPSSAPGTPAASGGAHSPSSEEMTMIGGASGELSAKQRKRDTPLGPLTALFGYPFWIFGYSASLSGPDFQINTAY